MVKFRIWFEQVNQTYIDVDEVNEYMAMKVAKEKWKEEAYPRPMDIQQVKQ